MRILGYIRRRLCGNKLLDNVSISREMGVRIGEDCQILDDPKMVFNNEPYLITIGNHVLITSGVRFLPHEGAAWILREKEDYKSIDIFAPIIVGSNVIIGMYSVITTGVHIGNNVIIGTHSVVTKDVPDDSVIAGNPARIICSVSSFEERLFCNRSRKVAVPTKGMSAVEKKKYLMDHFPEWFE